MERPIRGNRRIAGLAAVAMAAVIVALPVGTAVAVSRAADDELTRRAPELNEFTAVWTSGCDERPWPSERCTFGPEDASGTIALIGDSHASVLGDVVTHAGEQLGLRTMAFTKAGCAAALVPLPKDTAGCRPWLDATLEAVRSLDPEVIVVANRAPLYVLGREGHDPSGRRPIAPTAEQALDLWADGLRALFRSVDAPVLLIQSAPEQPPSVVNLMGTEVEDGDVPQLSMDEHLRRTGAINETERQVVEDLEEVLRFDPAGDLCSDKVCPARVEGTWRYFDGNHLTPDTTLLFTDDIRERLRRLLSGELRRANS